MKLLPTIIMQSLIPIPQTHEASVLKGSIALIATLIISLFMPVNAHAGSMFCTLFNVGCPDDPPEPNPPVTTNSPSPRLGYVTRNCPDEFLLKEAIGVDWNFNTPRLKTILRVSEKSTGYGYYGKWFTGDTADWSYTWRSRASIGVPYWHNYRDITGGKFYLNTNGKIQERSMYVTTCNISQWGWGNW